MTEEVQVYRIDTIVGESREGTSAAIDDALRKAEKRFAGVRSIEVTDVIVESTKDARSFEVMCRVVFVENC